MFSPTSRYAHLPTSQYQPAGVPDDEARAYVNRRFIPPVESLPPVSSPVVRASDRSDHLATTAYGDPAQAWRLADANRVRHLSRLSAQVGRRIAVPAVTPPPLDDLAGGDDT